MNEREPVAWHYRWGDEQELRVSTVDPRTMYIGGVRDLAPLYIDPQREWLPIETAPDDGTVILLYRHRPGSLSWVIGYAARNHVGNVFWTNYSGAEVETINPTHWMPLPAAPGDTPKPTTEPQASAEPDAVAVPSIVQLLEARDMCTDDVRQHLSVYVLSELRRALLQGGKGK